LISRPFFREGIEPGEALPNPPFEAYGRGMQNIMRARASSIHDTRRSAMGMFRSLLMTCCVGLVVISLSGCGEEKPAERAGPKVDEATEAGKTVAKATEEAGKKVEVKSDPEAGKKTYALLCASCHGNTGKGDGPAAAALPTKPQSHADGKYMNALTDQHLFKSIKEGGASVGRSPLMPPWGGQLTDQDIWNLVSYIRTLAVPPYKSAN
jgi:cytochrome c oxidase cbb3-type subunit III